MMGTTSPPPHKAFIKRVRVSLSLLRHNQHTFFQVTGPDVYTYYQMTCIYFYIVWQMLKQQ